MMDPNKNLKNNNSASSEKQYSSNELQKDLNNLFDDSPAPQVSTPPKPKASKPVSTVVGRAFDMIEQQLLGDLEKQMKIDSSGTTEVIDKRSTLIGKSLTIIRKKVLGKTEEIEQAPKEPVPSPQMDNESAIKPSKKPIQSVIHPKKPPPESVVEKPKKNSESSKVEFRQKNISEQKITAQSKTKKSYQSDETEDDLFDEEGNITSDSETNEKLDKLKEELVYLASTFWGYCKQIFNALLIFLSKVAAILLKIGIALVAPINAVFSKILKLDKKIPETESVPVKNEIKAEEPVELVVKGSFDDMLNLNITFTDNYDVALYKRSGMTLTKSEESLIMMNALEAIKQCAEFTKDAPAITDGHYKNSRIHEVMASLTEDDIAMFLGYVKAKPKKYIGKIWKISETFATWLLNNAPMGKTKIRV